MQKVCLAVLFFPNKRINTLTDYGDVVKKYGRYADMEIDFRIRIMNNFNNPIIPQTI